MEATGIHVLTIMGGKRKSRWIIRMYSEFNSPSSGELPCVHSSCWLEVRVAYWWFLCISPPARWGLLDFMSVACSSPPLLSSSSCSTATLDAQCSLSDLNHDHPRPVFPAGPQPRPSPPSVPCRTSTTTIHAQCSLPDLNREYPRQVFPCRTSCRKIWDKECAEES